MDGRAVALGHRGFLINAVPPQRDTRLRCPPPPESRAPSTPPRCRSRPRPGRCRGPRPRPPFSYPTVPRPLRNVNGPGEEHGAQPRFEGEQEPDLGAVARVEPAEAAGEQPFQI